MVELRLPGGTVRVVQGDITEMDVDAIVNAANAHLAGGGGVDGAVHRRGGPSIMRETRERFPRGCVTGRAVTTTAGELPARYVIHAVGPRWGVDSDAEALLASAWRSALAEAVDHDCGSLAFPSLSTGAYGFPVQQAAAIAVGEVADALAASHSGKQIDVSICTFSESDREAYEGALQRLQSG
ncbi:MAG: macro domain-containing protein [Candidatus Dormiibacterota bacterium]